MALCKRRLSRRPITWRRDGDAGGVGQRGFRGGGSGAAAGRAGTRAAGRRGREKRIGGNGARAARSGVGDLSSLADAGAVHGAAGDSFGLDRRGGELAAGARVHGDRVERDPHGDLFFRNRGASERGIPDADAPAARKRRAGAYGERDGAGDAGEPGSGASGLLGLHDFGPHHIGSAGVGPQLVGGNGGSNQNLGAGDLQTIYGINKVHAAGFSGQGQTIAVLEASNVYSTGDWLAYRRVFGLTKAFPQGQLVVEHPSGASPCSEPGSRQCRRRSDARCRGSDGGSSQRDGTGGVVPEHGG